jgi:hypothetical protein
MDCVTGFDEDEYFFASYDTEQASIGVSLAWQEFDEAEARVPTPEQLSHLGRFRRPVAGVVAALALLSIVALAKHGFLRHGAQRELVAHYGSAIAAPTATAIAGATVEQTAVVDDASSVLVPDAWSTFLDEATSAFVQVASVANAAAPTAVSETAPALGTAGRETTLAEISTQPGPVRAFISVLTAMCLRPAGRDVTLAGPSDASRSRWPLSKSRNRSIPAAFVGANSAALVAAKPLATFNSVARFPDVQR